MPEHGKGHSLKSEGATQAQVPAGSILISFGPKPELDNPLPVSYKVLRALRKDPTIALARAVAIAPAVLGEWSVESKDDVQDEWLDFARDQFMSIRSQIMETAMSGGIDFGWQPYEKVFQVIERGDFAGKIGLRRLKPLLHDITSILVEKDGSFAGFYQEESKITVPLEQALLIPFRVEGTQWHGSSLLENARASVEKWEKANEGAARYDRKVAGAHWVITYPQGKTIASTVAEGTSVAGGGTERGNREIAVDIMNSLQSAGSCILPGAFTEGDEWKIELMSDSGSAQGAFVERLSYLDSQKVRAMLLPERVVTEGQYGTKAEAETHTDTALQVMEMSIELITTMVSWHVLDQLLALNFGDEARGAVYLKAMPLADAQAEFLRSVYKSLLANASTLVEEYGAIDTESLRDKFGVPSGGELLPVDQAVETPFAPQEPAEEPGLEARA